MTSSLSIFPKNNSGIITTKPGPNATRPHLPAISTSRKMNRPITPPSSKRRRFPTPDNVSSSTPPEKKIRISSPLPNPSNIRIFSWNINGITPFLHRPSPSNTKITKFLNLSKVATTKDSPNVTTSPPPLQSNLRTFLHRHHWPQILFLQEVKIASTDTKTQDAVRASINTPLPAETSTSSKNPGTGPGPTYTVDFTLPTDRHNARGLRGSGKIYGVCSIIRSDLSSLSRVRSADWDAEGRVSIVEIFAPGLKLAILNIYAVNGTDSAYRDPGIGAIVGTRHERKRAFHRLLRDECRDMERKGWMMLIGGDLNVAPDARDGWPRLRVWPSEHVDNRADFHRNFLDTSEEDEEEGGKIRGECSLRGVDVWRQMHGDERRYTYFPRGRKWGTSCDRVDYFIAGRSLWESDMVKGCGILDSEEERGPSDHVPIWVEVEVSLEKKGGGWDGGGKAFPGEL